MPAPLDPEVRTKIRKLAKAGYAATAIGKQLGIGRHTAARYMPASAGSNTAAHQGATLAAPGPDTGATVAEFTPGEIEHLHWIARMTARSECPECGKAVLFFRGHAARGRCLWCYANWEIRASAPANQHR